MRKDFIGARQWNEQQLMDTLPRPFFFASSPLVPSHDMKQDSLYGYRRSCVVPVAWLWHTGVLRPSSPSVLKSTCSWTSPLSSYLMNWHMSSVGTCAHHPVAHRWLGLEPEDKRWMSADRLVGENQRRRSAPSWTTIHISWDSARSTGRQSESKNRILD